jgi:hypothetical protein
MIMMTGKPSLDSSNKALELGAVRYLIKPVFPAALKEAVERAAEAYALRRMKQGGVTLECVCTVCGRVGKGTFVARHWRRYPLGWLVGDAERGLACSEVCAKPIKREGCCCRRGRQSGATVSVARGADTIH